MSTSAFYARPTTSGGVSQAPPHDALGLSAMSFVEFTSPVADRRWALGDFLTSPHFPGLDLEAATAAPPRSAGQELTERLLNATSLTIEEASRLAGVSRRTWYNWRDGASMSAARETRLNELLEIFADWTAAAEVLRSALRGSSGRQSIIDLIGAGAQQSVIRAHLRERLGPSRGRSSESAPLELLPDTPPDPRVVDPRTLLKRGALPYEDGDSGAE